MRGEQALELGEREQNAKHYDLMQHNMRGETKDGRARKAGKNGRRTGHTNYKPTRRT